ncbi:MAG: hypothetical protein HQM16_16410 [Deltaproteobacteria bacterium]|nr:hypothetical protein [Deltaproteobacteria bacterium]
MADVSNKNDGSADDHETLLVTVASDSEAAIIVSLLNSEKIPARRVAKGAGGYLKITMGANLFGEDIYVPKSCYEDARALMGSANLAATAPPLTTEELTTEELTTEEQLKNKKAKVNRQSTRGRRALAILLTPLVLMAILLLLKWIFRT